MQKLCRYDDTEWLSDIQIIVYWCHFSMRNDHIAPMHNRFLSILECVFCFSFALLLDFSSIVFIANITFSCSVEIVGMLLQSLFGKCLLNIWLTILEAIPRNGSSNIRICQSQQYPFRVYFNAMLFSQLIDGYKSVDLNQANLVKFPQIWFTIHCLVTICDKSTKVDGAAAHTLGRSPDGDAKEPGIIKFRFFPLCLHQN